MKVIVKTPNRYELDALLAALEKKGFRVHPVESRDRIINEYYRTALCINVNDNQEATHHCSEDWYSKSSVYNKWPMVSVSTFFKDFYNDLVLEKPLRVGTYKVKDITKDGFDVGCQHVSWDELAKIAAKRPNYNFNWREQDGKDSN